MARQTTVKNPLAYRQRGRGGRDEEKRIEGEHWREHKGNQNKNPPAETLPQATIVAGGETRGENQHEMERWHNPQSREGGEVPSRKRIADKKQDNVHRKEK